MFKYKEVIILPLMVITLVQCSKSTPISLKERLHNAYLDVIEEDENDLRPLVNLTHDDPLVTWNESNDKVLLFTLHRFPTSYIEGTTCTITWGESWLCSAKEYAKWYLDNKNNIKDPLLRTKQLLGMSDDSRNTYISSLWFNPSDVYRPAYVTSPTKPMSLSFDEGNPDWFRAWFNSQYYYSYDVSKLPWTRLGYTYDWSKEAKDKYGLSEFIAFDGVSFVVEKTLPVEEFVNTLI